MTEEIKTKLDITPETTTSERPEPATATPEKTGAFESLRLPNFRLLWTGSVLAYSTQWITQVILSWLIYDLTGSGTILGAIVLIMSAASLCMLPMVGLLVDYFDRRKLLQFEIGCMLVLTLALGLVLVTGHSNVVYLFTFAFLCGLTGAIDQNLRQVLVFDLVPRNQTPGAMALNQTGWSVMRVLGPSMGGFLLIWCGAGGSFLVQAAIFLLISLTVLRMKVPERKRAPIQNSPMQNIKDGLSYLAREPVTRTFTLIGIVMPILVVPVFATLPAIYAVQVFGDGSGRVLGFLMASVGVGGVIGGIAITYLRRMERWGLIQLAAIFLVSLTFIAFALTSTLWIALILMVLSGFFEIIFLTINMTLIQLTIPDNLRSRVTAVISLTWIISPLGSLLAGAGADLFGNPTTITLLMAGAAGLIVIVIWLASPTVRNYRLSQAMSKSE